MDDAAARIILAAVLGSFTGSTSEALRAGCDDPGYGATVILAGPPLLGCINELAKREGTTLTAGRVFGWILKRSFSQTPVRSVPLEEPSRRNA